MRFLHQDLQERSTVRQYQQLKYIVYKYRK